MTDDDLEKIKTKKDKTIHILQFAKIAEINSIYYEKDPGKRNCHRRYQ